nr:unnamed protein product [Digitaria exilis]
MTTTTHGAENASPVHSSASPAKPQDLVAGDPTDLPITSAATTSAGQPKGRNKLTLFPLIFFEVAGGPYGAEPAVQAAGPLLALIAFLVFPFFWAVPESLVTAELSTAMPGNGGYVVWVDRAFGPFAGSLMGTWKYVWGAFSAAAFPALCSDYLSRVVPAVSTGGGRLTTIVTFNVAFLTYTGLGVVGWSAVALGIASLSPFVVMPGIAVPKIRPSRWGVTAGDKDWKLFLNLNTMFWNLNYWDSVSTMAGEVDRPGKTRSCRAVCMASLGYLLPLLAGIGATDTPPEAWGNGYFADAAGVTSTLRAC